MAKEAAKKQSLKWPDLQCTVLKNSTIFVHRISHCWKNFCQSAGQTIMGRNCKGRPYVSQESNHLLPIPGKTQEKHWSIECSPLPEDWLIFKASAICFVQGKQHLPNLAQFVLLHHPLPACHHILTTYHNTICHVARTAEGSDTNHTCKCSK